MRRSDLPIPILWTVVALLAWLAIATAPEVIVRDRFLVIPGGWWRALSILALGILGFAGTAWLWGRSRRPMRAGRYAVAAGTHLFMITVVFLSMYPAIYLLSVSLNRSNSLAGALPTEGSLLIRAGVWPDPADFSWIQYQKVIGATHVLWYQWIFIAAAVLALAVLLGLTIRHRVRPMILSRLERARRWAGVGLFAAVAVLVLTVTPDQFYSIGPAGEQVPVSGERMVILFIRNTLLISGLTGLFAVIISTTAGYAFARLKFAGRYGTLMTFVFVQMFPGFMALVAIYYLMSYLDLLNTFTGLILAYSGGAIAFSAWIFKGYLESISPSLEEAALVDGSTRWGAFWRIILPISVPMLLFIFLLQFISTYSEFILANTLLIGIENWTVGIGLRSFTQRAFATQWGAMAASAVLGSLPILAIFYAFQDALTGQYQSGGVKG